MDQVPVIDLTAARAGDEAGRRQVARLIDEACVEIGFFAITGHGVPESVCQALREAAHEFFALPADVKRRASPSDAAIPRGYHALGGEALAAANDAVAPPDLKEFYHVGPVDIGDDPYYTSPKGRQFFVPNIWPAEPPAFRPAAITYYRTMHRLVGALMRLTALGLGLEETFFDDKVDRSIGTMRLNYYPRQARAPLPGQLRAGAHTDYGGLTILNGEDVPGGLQVRTRSGRWIDVRTSPEQFVVNIGDLLMRWTNDRWLSNIPENTDPPSTIRV
jgi:isopenicillin N synthase-like dioxygenase